ncbi:MAG: hypothetical protein ABSG86_22430 [Thermoguttaceae bacterium]|jgi:hypothetical protein
MVRFTHIPVVLAALIASLPVGAMGQTAIAAPGRPAAEAAGSPEPNPLPGLPRPPDQPGSLLQPAPTGQVYACPELECPYFEKDPRLDPAGLPQPGWLFDVELGVLGSHVVDKLGQPPFPNGNPVPFIVSVPMARLDWTVSPRFELGYRLPSGFGELDVAYRFLLTEGTGSTPAGSAASPDAAAALTSHLRINLGDVDYASRETSLGPNWGMKWRIGLRTADVFFDSQADEPFAAAAAPGASKIFERSIQDNFWGIGPHAALELDKRRNAWGLGWLGRLDGALLFGRVRQSFAEVSTTPGGGGAFDLINGEQAPMLNGFLGLDWRPPCRPNLDILLGFTAEYWWNVGRMSDPDMYNGRTAGEVGSYGPLLRLEYNY